MEKAGSGNVCILPCYAVLDGGSATDLISLGHSNIDDDPLWSARILHTDLESINNVHRRFLEAGADVIETVTYQASVPGFKQHLGLQEREALDLMVTGVKAAVKVRDQFWRENPHLHPDRRRPLVAGSVGPFGACEADGSEYTGSYVDHMSHQELMTWHRPRIEVLLRSGVDLVAMETMPAQKEAEALCTLLEEFPGAKAWISFSCKDGEHLRHGEQIVDVAKSLIGSKEIFGIGINCTAPEYIGSLIKCVRPVLEGKTLIVAPNSGEKWTEEKRWHGEAECRPIHEYVPQWLHLGAKWIGGCCRVNPGDISKIRTAMSSVLQSAS